MKKLIALALTTLISAGVHATTIANFDVSVSGDLYFVEAGPINTYSGNGTATLDDNGSITLKISDHSVISMPYLSTPQTYIYDTTSITTFNGTWNNSAFTPNSATTQFLSCTGSGYEDLCPYLDPYVHSTSLRNISGAVSILGGSLAGIIDENTRGIALVAQYTLTPSTVPVPATGWLFGSALLALPRLRKFRQLNKN